MLTIKITKARSTGPVDNQILEMPIKESITADSITKARNDIENYLKKNLEYQNQIFEIYDGSELILRLKRLLGRDSLIITQKSDNRFDSFWNEIS